MRYKDNKYSFCCNKELKEEFKTYCKICGVSPSDVLGDVMKEFVDNAKRIMEMKDVTELRQLFMDKMNTANEEIKKFKDDK